MAFHQALHVLIISSWDRMTDTNLQEFLAREELILTQVISRTQEHIYHYMI